MHALAMARNAHEADHDPMRRRWLGAAATAFAGLATRHAAASAPSEPLPAGGGGDGDGDRTLSVYTFGDSILDCGHYNAFGITPGGLLVQNDDARFPAFKGRDLQSVGPTRLLHRARDGATVDDLASQAPEVTATGRSIALLTVGGNDLLRGLAADSGAGLIAFERRLLQFLQTLRVRPLFLGNVYDPTFGDDKRNFLGVPARTARANHRRVNDIIGRAAARHGRLVDLHARFLMGTPDWFTHTIEPSLEGASEVRRAFLVAIGPFPAKASTHRTKTPR